MSSAFNRGSRPEEYKNYKHQIKIPVTCYNQDMEDFCNKHFGDTWSLRHCFVSYDECYRPFLTHTKVYYIVGFMHEEHAVFFKITYSEFTEPLTGRSPI